MISGFSQIEELFLAKTNLVMHGLPPDESGGYSILIPRDETKINRGFKKSSGFVINRI